MRLNYLTRMALRLGAGIGDLDETFRQKVRDFVLARQDAGGGFVGRKGGGEIYYSAFALRTLALLGELNRDSVSAKTLSFLDERLDDYRDERGRWTVRPSRTGADLASLILATNLIESGLNRDFFASRGCDSAAFVRQTWRSLERSDGGFASSVKSGDSSVYQTFLTAVSYRTIGLAFATERSRRLADFVAKRRKPDGGFSDLAIVRTAGTNPTAAALGLIQILEETAFATTETRSASNDLGFRTDDAFRDGEAAASEAIGSERVASEAIGSKRVESELIGSEAVASEVLSAAAIKKSAIEYLLAARQSDGGFRAHSNLPFSDLLSSFSATVALLTSCDANSSDGGDWLPSLERYVDSLATPDGGFRGGVWDRESDVEYAFYGLALKSVCAANRAF